jgi:Cu/Ag efflux pump CusA
VAERLTQAYVLPNVGKPPQMLQPQSSTNRVMLVGVTSRNVSAIRMSVLARWTIVPRLMGVPGVANVAIWGQRDRQLQVQVDPTRMREHRVTLNQVLETTGNALWFSPLTFVEASTPGTGGLIDTPNQRLGIQHFSPITTPATLAKVPIEETDGKLRLGDVANIVADHQQPLIGDALVDGGPGLLLLIEKFPDANTLQVTHGVERAIRDLQPGLRGIHFDTTIYRPASYVEKSIDNVKLALILGAALLVLAFGALIFRWRTGLVALLTVPVSLVVAALVLYALGNTMNALVLTGLVAALVVVIDEAVVGADAIATRLRRERAEGARTSLPVLMLEATAQVRGAAVWGTLAVALATVPLFFLHSLSGSFFPHAAVAFLVSLGAAMAVALTLTPALAVLLFSRGGAERESPAAAWVQARYERALAQLVSTPSVALGAAALLVVAGVFSAPFLKHSLLPTFKESTLLIRWDGPPGTSLPEMDRITSRASAELRSLKGVEDVGAHVGRAVTADQVVDVNSGELWVTIDPHANYDATLAAVKRVVAGYPGLSEDIQTFSNSRAHDVLSGAQDDLTVRLYGEDLSRLAQKATQVQHAIRGVGGIVDPRVQLPQYEPGLQIKVDIAKADHFGVKPGDVRRAAATLLQGIVAGSLFENQKVFDVVVRGGPQTRSNLTSIKRLFIDTPGGGHVRLGQVASVKLVPTPTVIRHQAVSRYVDVTANVGGDVGAAVRGVNRALAAIRFPTEMHPEVIATPTQSLGRLISIAVAAAVGILLLLQAAFGSWRLALLSFVTLPLAVVGGLVAAVAAGGTLSLGSYLGLLAVFGLAARNNVLLITGYRRREQQNGEASFADLVVGASRERLAPTLTAAVTAAVVVAPLAIRGSIAGYELIHPLSLVILGGLVSATAVNAFVVPVLYARFGAAAESDAEVTPAEVLLGRLRAWRRKSDVPEVPAAPELP